MQLSAPIDEISGRGELTSFDGFGGVRLVGECWGEQDHPAVLFLPAGGQSRAAYRHSARALAAAGRRAVCIDLRGHGDSDWPADGRYDLDSFAQDVVGILRRLGSRPAVIAASLSGMAALAALGESEVELASALIIADAAPDIDQHEAARVRALINQHASGFDHVDAAAEAARQLSPRRAVSGDPSKLREHLRSDEEGRLRWNWDEKSLSGFSAPDVATRLEASASKIKVPVLLLRGEESEMVTLDALTALQSLMPDAELKEVPGAGHLVASEQPELFDAMVLEFLERRAPREPVSYIEGAAPRTLRDALGCFATGVTVVTTMSDEGPVGITANSFTAVSLEPPLILVCIGKQSSSLPSFEQSGRFVINMLHIGQQLASNAFAGPKDVRFSSVKWHLGAHGAPVLDDSLASFECETHSMQEAGDHVVLIGRVKAAIFEPRRDPLLFFRGRYRRLHFS